jgi:hypothetical protein
MCVTSTVIDGWRDPTWPQITPHNPGPFTLPASPNAIPWPMIQQDPSLAVQMLEVLKRLEALDRRLDKMEQCAVTAREKKNLKARLRRIASKAKPSNGTVLI